MEMTQEIMSRLDAIAAKFGETADYFWPKMVENQIIEGWIKISSPFLGILVGIILFYVGFRLHKKDNFNDAEDYVFGFIAVGIAVGLLSVVFAFASVPMGIKELYNPEVYALQELLRMF